MIEEAAHLYAEGWSLPKLGRRYSIPISTMRHRLLAAGVVMRTRAEAVRTAEGLGSGTRGKTRETTPEWRANIAAAKLRWADIHAVGVSLKPDGWVEYTRGPHKGRGVHCVVAEELLGRPLRPGEVVHHIDFNRSNNTPTNLMVLTNSEHIRLHRWWDRLVGKQRKRGPNGRYL